MSGEKPREEILVSPEFSILEFGDGYSALLQGSKMEFDSEGRKIAIMTIKPSQLLKKRYDIKDSQLDRNGNIIFKAVYDDLIPMNLLDDANRKWLYIKTYNHDDTEISKIGWDLRERLKWSKNRIYILEGQLIHFSEQLALAKTNPTEFVSQGLDVIKEFAEVTESLRDRTRKEE